MVNHNDNIGYYEPHSSANVNTSLSRDPRRLMLSRSPAGFYLNAQFNIGRLKKIIFNGFLESFENEKG